MADVKTLPRARPWPLPTWATFAGQYATARGSRRRARVTPPGLHRDPRPDLTPGQGILIVSADGGVPGALAGLGPRENRP